MWFEVLLNSKVVRSFVCNHDGSVSLLLSIHKFPFSKYSTRKHIIFSKGQINVNIKMNISAVIPPSLLAHLLVAVRLLQVNCTNRIYNL